MRIRDAIVAGAVLAISCSAATLAQAAIWDGTGGSAYTPPSLNYFGAGPQSSGGVTWSSTNGATQGGSVYGYTGIYGFEGNGNWSGPPMEGLNDFSDAYGPNIVDTMTFTFAAPVTAFGGEINWAPNALPVTISAWDGGTLLDTLTLSSGDANLQPADAFYGFIEGTADITSFTMTDGYVGIRNIEAIGLPGGVPEPATWAMTLLGVGMIGSGLRMARRNANVTASFT